MATFISAQAEIGISSAVGPIERREQIISFSASKSRPELSFTAFKPRPKHLRIHASQQQHQNSVVASSPTPPSPETHQNGPVIEIEFVGAPVFLRIKGSGKGVMAKPDNRPGETDPIPEPQYVSVVSGQKLLRDVMLENQVELYGPYGKMMNCEGRGMCGTCLVDILEGAELMNKRTPAEPYYLKLRPDSWRLACQATVGDGTNGGKMKVKRRPQKGNPLM